MKKVLIIAYTFPPRASAGVSRILRFINYIREFQWEPVVLTISERSASPADRTLLKRIPQGMKVIRTRLYNPFFYRHKLGTDETKKRRAEETKSSFSKNRIETLKNKMKRLVRDYLFIPDDKIWWFPEAVIKGAWQIFKDPDIIAIYSSSPPFTVHLIACVLKKMTGKPWIADFRDGWTMSVSETLRSGPEFTRKIHNLLEHNVLKAADRIITVSEPIIGGWRKKYADIEKSKYSVITNGFDRREFAGVEKQAFDRFTITYTGNFYGNRQAANFMKAMDALLKERQELRGKLQVYFLGFLGKSGADLINSLGLHGVVHSPGFVGRKQCFEYLLGSDVLLLVIRTGPGSERVYTGKIFEYLAAQKPILALVPENGVAAALIRELNAGVVADPEDISSIKDAIYDLYLNKLKIAIKAGELKRFDSRELTGKLARSLDAVTAAS